MPATLQAGPQVAPPLTERKATSPPAARIGTTTSPPGCTTGSPPVACSRALAGVSGDQDKPPSREVLISTRPSWLSTSHAMEQLP